MIDCSIHFELMPHAFPTERAKVAFMILHLAGRAKAWASTRTFDPVCSSREKAQELSTLKQGNASVCDYAIHFRTLAAESGWNKVAL